MVSWREVMDFYSCTFSWLLLLIYSLITGKSITGFALSLPCDPSCVNGVCVADHGRLSCSCESNWSGENCSVFVCDGVESVCENGGRCLPDPDNYTNFLCHCPEENLLGDRCQYTLNADSCSGQDCSGNGYCVGTVGGGFECRCREGKFGPICEFSGEDPCEIVNHCHGHGVCSYVEIGEDVRHNCTCDLGYVSTTDCQSLNPTFSLCREQRCYNGGTCSENLTSYTCQCPPDYVGDNCTEPFDVCGGACHNGGTCSEIANGHYFNCTCPADYSGYSCDIAISTGEPPDSDGTASTAVKATSPSTIAACNFCLGEDYTIGSGIMIAVLSLSLAVSVCVGCACLATKRRKLLLNSHKAPEQLVEDVLRKAPPHSPSPLPHLPAQATPLFLEDAQPDSPIPSPPTASYLEQLVGENLC